MPLVSPNAHNRIALGNNYAVEVIYCFGLQPAFFLVYQPFGESNEITSLTLPEGAVMHDAVMEARVTLISQGKSR